MAGTDTGGEPRGGAQSPLGVDMKLEVVTLPVSDIERAKRFYEGLGLAGPHPCEVRHRGSRSSLGRGSVVDLLQSRAREQLR